MHDPGVPGCQWPDCPGEVVAAAVVADVIPVYDSLAGHEEFDRHICVSAFGIEKYPGSVEVDYADDLSYLSDYGVTFTPGGYAVALTEIERRP